MSRHTRPGPGSTSIRFLEGCQNIKLETTTPEQDVKNETSALTTDSFERLCGEHANQAALYVQIKG